MGGARTPLAFGSGDTCRDRIGGRAALRRRRGRHWMGRRRQSAALPSSALTLVKLANLQMLSHPPIIGMSHGTGILSCRFRLKLLHGAITGFSPSLRRSGICLSLKLAAFGQDPLLAKRPRCTFAQMLRCRGQSKPRQRY